MVWREGAQKAAGWDGTGWTISLLFPVLSSDMRRYAAMMLPLGRMLPLALLLVDPAIAAADTLRVGPGARYSLPSQAAAVARAGDTILIAPGRYRDCAVWRVPDLTIAAARGGTVEIFGPVCNDKALFVTAAPRIVIDGITFRDAVATPGNGAGIRAEGGDLRVTRSRFLGNQNGILAASQPQATLSIEDSVFIGNGALIGECAHGIYANDYALVSIRRTRFEGTRVCHHVKSRAARTEIVDSAILDTPDGEASYLVDIPNGGNLLIRNTDLRKGPRSGNPGAAIVIGAEGQRHPTASLRVIGNRFANLMTRETVFVRNLTATPAELSDNTLTGRVTPLQGPGRSS